MRRPRISNKDYYTSIGLALGSALSLALASAFGKHLTTWVSLNVVLFVRFFAPFVLLAPLFFVFRKKNRVPIKILPYAFRTLFTVIAQYCLFFLLSRGNLLLAILLYSTSGIFLPLLAKLMFNAEVKLKTLIAITAGLVGTAITLGPIHHVLGFDVLMGLFSGFFAACSQLVSHYVSKKQDPITSNFIMYGASSFLTLLLLVASIHYAHASLLMIPSAWYVVGIVLLFSVFSIGNRICRSLAYKRVNKAASLAPFLYASLIFSAIIDWLWLGIVPTWHVYIGISILIIAGVIMSVRSRK